MDRHAFDTRVRRAAPLLVVGVTLAVLALALYFMVEALEERQSAAEASDLRAASLMLASADALIGTPLESSMVNLDGSRAILEGDHEAALHSLSPARRDRANELLGGLSMGGHSHVHNTDEHAELQRLLDLAVEGSESDAAAAERLAAASVVAAFATLAGAAWALARARHRVDRDAIAAASESALRHRLETLLNDLPDMLFVFDADGRITYRSASANELLSSNASIDELLERVSAEDRPRLVSHLEAQSDTLETFEVDTLSGPAFLDVRVTDLADDEYVDGHLVTARDVTSELALRAELESQASLDALTGLPNRRALDPALDDARRRAGTGSVGLLLLDLDEFKDINDTLGHLAGDQILREAAARILGVLRSDETLLRLGGDEFAVVLAPVTNQHALAAAGSRIQSAMRRSFDLGETSEKMRTSIGAVMLTGPFETDELLGKADIALYEAKEAGGDRLVAFEAEMEDRAQAISNIMRALRTVDFDDEFALVYQPIFDAESEAIVSVEALLRWTSPTLGFVSPGEFIPIAERIGLMPSIGGWVLNSVCRQAAEWSARGLDRSTTVSFNVSAQQLEEADFVESVFAATERWGVRPDRLVVEVTESMVIDHEGAIIERLETLRRGGLKISIDDFGSGYSNLGQLLGVPLDLIKIDRDLLLRLGAMRDGAGGDPSDPCAIMQAIVSIAQMLQAPVVCEGVETETQRASLRASGVTYLQGYLLGRPTPPEDLPLELDPLESMAGAVGA